MSQEPKLPASLDIETAAIAQVVDDSKEDNDDVEELDDSSPLWNREDEGWELTWPIWHMLPWFERKAIAKRHGYTSIGAFEEYMSLQQSLGDSEVTKKRYFANEEIYPKDLHSTPGAGASVRITEAKKPEEEEEDEDSDSDDNADYRRQVSACTEDLSLEELLLVGGKLLMLHDEMLHQVFSWLPVDTYGTLAMVSPHWKHLTRTELVYKRLCERLYLNQSKRRQLHVSRFGGSYRIMLEQRPRVRAAGGCYVLKYTQVKKIQRDMWTEIPAGAILATVYYRYLYFQEDGRVLYALTSSPPHEMFRRLRKMCLKKTKDAAAVWGTFQVQKNVLSVTARQAWHTIKFELTIEMASLYGRFGCLILDRHFSSPSACFEEWSNDRVEYQVPAETFRFIKDPRL